MHVARALAVSVLLSGLAACAGMPDVYFDYGFDGGGTSSGSSMQADGASEADGAAVAEDAGTPPSNDASPPPASPSPAADASVPKADASPPHAPPPPTPTPPTPAPPPMIGCPGSVPEGATLCCGAIPCIGMKCDQRCADCAACAGKLCCVPNGNGHAVTCGASASDCGGGGGGNQGGDDSQ